jgi:hypothetical protein
VISQVQSPSGTAFSLIAKVTEVTLSPSPYFRFFRFQFLSLLPLTPKEMFLLGVYRNNVFNKAKRRTPEDLAIGQILHSARIDNKFADRAASPK